MYKPSFSVILSNVGNCSDRYCSSYSAGFSIEKMFERVASISGVTGIELVANWHVTDKNVNLIQGMLEQYNLKLVSIIPDHFSNEKWKKGAFSSKNESIRKEAIAHTKTMIDVAECLGGNLISLWPGQDGYDYFFTSDYEKERGYFENGIKECCEYKNNINISIEYKAKEPRIRSYPSNVYSTLLMVKEIGLSNCGVTIDYGHSIAAYENAAESVAVLKKYGNKLFHLHMNDNYGLWDDDMIVGTVNTISYLEFVYYLKKTNYTGYMSTDQYPYREDGRDSVAESIAWMNKFFDVLDKIDAKTIEQTINSGDAVMASKMLREYIL